MDLSRYPSVYELRLPLSWSASDQLRRSFLILLRSSLFISPCDSLFVTAGLSLAFPHRLRHSTRPCAAEPVVRTLSWSRHPHSLWSHPALSLSQSLTSQPIETILVSVLPSAAIVFPEPLPRSAMSMARPRVVSPIPNKRIDFKENSIHRFPGAHTMNNLHRTSIDTLIEYTKLCIRGNNDVRDTLSDS